MQEGFPTQNPKAMFVGGCVRKFLSNEKIDDIDIATSLTTEQIIEKFQNSKFKIIKSGIKHGTITLISNKLKFEITTLRKDIKTDGRHAEVQYIDDWQEDSDRRDFTINAIYLDIKGKIFDPQSGVNDLKNRIVKFIGDPSKRIQEDYLRIIRFIRFSLEYSDVIEKSTIDNIKLNLNGVNKISKERIILELFKILQIKNFVKLNNNENLKEIFKLIFPEFKYLERLNKLCEISSPSILSKNCFLAILLVDDTNNHEYFSHKYNISNDLKETLNLTAKNFLNFIANKNFFFNDLKKNIYFFGKEHLKILNTLNFSNSSKIKLSDYLSTLNNINKSLIPKFPFDGNYLKDNGIKEGEIIGKVLKILEKEWLENNFKISNQRVVKIINDRNN